MKLSDFHYHLPEELIAQKPIEKRDESRLLILDKNTWKIEEKKFKDILEYLWENDVLVVNKTKVINARLRGEMDIFPKWKKQIKEVEIFLHKQITADTWECLGYPGKNLKVWRTIRFFDENKKIIMTGYIEKVSEMGRFIKFDTSWVDFYQTIESIGEIPLPPYIVEKLSNMDRYQTVYSKDKGSVAAPTAWLHFTQELLDNLRQKWVIIEEVLLHVWVGTFKPVEAENILDHQMHHEYIELEEAVAKRLNTYKKQGKNIIAVGTTSVRVLESFASDSWELAFWAKDTSIFIYPWYKWKFVDNLVTNFHLPASTLLMLVSALAWQENIKTAYEYAVQNKFRFFSFWDAMFIR